MFLIYSPRLSSLSSVFQLVWSGSVTWEKWTPRMNTQGRDIPTPRGSAWLWRRHRAAVPLSAWFPPWDPLLSSPRLTFQNLDSVHVTLLSK